MDGGGRTAGLIRSTTRRERPVASPPRFTLAPSVLVVGASTGGPQAVTALVAALCATGVSLPICVTMHMPADLMPVIAAHVARTCGIETCVVAGPRELKAGALYFSPGDRHLAFRRDPTLSVEPGACTGPARKFCQPAVDVMFASAAASLGPRALAVVLSGMGKDGLAGARAIVAAGGSVLIQDKGSSAVWGMPGAIAKAELASAALAPEALAMEIARRVRLDACRPAPSRREPRA